MGWPKFEDNIEIDHTEIHICRLDLSCMI